MVAAILGAAALPVFGQANLERGKKVYEECIACHDLKPGEQEVGPTLKGVLGRAAGTLQGFRFSAAMKRSGITWDRAALEKFLADPQELVRGNRMPYSGISEPADLSALLDFLESVGR
jgi:cytochrome c